MNISELRKQIDHVDRQIVELFEKRMEICDRIGDVKLASGGRVFDRDRELDKLRAVRELAHTDLNKTGAEELFRLLMSVSRKLQYRKLSEAGALGRLPFIGCERIDTEGARVVYQGAEGAYSEAAAIDYFGEDANTFHVETFRDAMFAIEEGSADYCVLPIENSTAGTVDEIYDLLSEFENYIIGERIIDIRHCLIGLPGTELSQVRRVYSHPQSLMQSARFLSGYSWEQVGMRNNAFAVKKVADDGDMTQVAIASERAAGVYGLDVLLRGVNQQDNNATRFIIVTNQKIYEEGADKVSICLELAHETGELYRLMSHFIYNDLNMTRIESRPIPERSWEYRFFIDFEGNLADSAVKNALRGLREEAASLRILGNYRADRRGM